jgi:hypothetical protein
MSSLLQAQDPTTTPERLRQLFESKEPSLLSALAENPNTPIDLLLELIATHTESFFRNPVLSVLLLENPNLFLELPSQTLSALLSLSEPHPWLLSVLESPHEFTERHGVHIVRTLAEKARSKQVLARLTTFSSGRSSVASNLNAPSELLEALLLDEEELVQSNAAQNPNLSVEILVGLSFSKDSKIVSWAASNPGMPIDRLERLLKSQTQIICVAAKRTLGRLARNKSTPIDTLRRLHRSENKTVCQSAYVTLMLLVSDPKTPMEMLAQFAEDEDEKLRSRALAEQAMRQA